MKADHMAFQVPDLDVAIAFYTDKLGMRLLFREMDPTHHEAFAFLELDGCNIELLQVLDEANRPLPVSSQTPRPPYCPHLAISTDDLDAVILSLTANGVPIVKGPLEIPGKVRWLYLADPAGNVLEFVEWVRKDGALTL